MLIAAITAIVLLMGGGNHLGMNETLENLAELVGKKVQSEEQAREAHALISDAQTEVESFERLVLEGRRQVWEVDADYDATAADYERAFARINAAWDEMEKDLVDMNIELRKHITAEEWEAIYDEMKKKRR
jgi:hypothetical protein